MTLNSDLWKAFAARLAPEPARRLREDAGAPPRLASIIEHARAQVGDLGLDLPRFAGFLGERCVDANEPLEALQSLHTADLYLACACCSHLASALALLERRHISQLPQGLARLSLSGATTAEAVQQVRAQLVVPGGQGRSALERYLGRAPLQVWLRVVALRTAMNLMRAQGKEVPVGDSFLEEQLAQGDDAEASYLRQAYRPAFRSAFAAALAALETRQRNLLRQHYLDGLTVERLAVMYSVHRVTLSRWIGAARRALAEGVESELTGLLGLRRSECASVVRLCMSRPDITLASFLGPEDDTGGTARTPGV